MVCTMPESARVDRLQTATDQQRQWRKDHAHLLVLVQGALNDCAANMLTLDLSHQALGELRGEDLQDVSTRLAAELKITYSTENFVVSIDMDAAHVKIRRTAVVN